MPSAKSGSSAAYHPSWGLVIANGYDDEGSSTDTIIRTTDGKTFSELPAFPDSLRHTCLQILDETRLFLSGHGYNPERFAAYIFSRSDKYEKLTNKKQN